jgi:endonuclease V-like protein UPF0215 family
MPVVGVEDGSFRKGITRRALLVAVLLKGMEIEGVKSTKILVDGFDATEKLTEILNAWEFAAVILSGVSFAGFNLIDPTVIYEKFKKPVIIISRTKPNNRAVKRALQRHFEDWRMRWKVVKKLGLAHEVNVLNGKLPVYVETVGANLKLAKTLVKALSVCCRVPEPIRVARLVAVGLSNA